MRGLVSSDRPANERGVTQTLDIIRTSEALARLQPEWDDLYLRSSPRNPFLSHAWTEACWSAQKAGAEPFVVTLRDGDRLVAVAPLCIEKQAGFRILRFIADDRSDYLGFLCEAGTDGLEQQLLKHVLATNGELGPRAAPPTHGFLHAPAQGPTSARPFDRIAPNGPERPIAGPRAIGIRSTNPVPAGSARCASAAAASCVTGIGRNVSPDRTRSNASTRSPTSKRIRGKAASRACACRRATAVSFLSAPSKPSACAAKWNCGWRSSTTARSPSRSTS